MNNIAVLGILFTFITQLSYAQNIYTVEQGDSTLSPSFVTTICAAARNHMETEPGKPHLLEQLILNAAEADFNQESTSSKTYSWHSKYGKEIFCPATGTYPAGNFLRQVVYSDFRDFANIIGPKNRLALNLLQQDPYDSLNMFDFVDERRLEIEASHKNKRFEFQQDETWRNIMFFYFLFSEYKINYDAHLKE